MIDVSLWWRKRWDRPLERLERALDKLAERTEKWHGVNLAGDRQLAKTGRHFNQAVKTLRDIFQEQKSKIAASEAQVQSLTEYIKQLEQKREECQRRIQELSILRELSERIGYSLGMQNIVEVYYRQLREIIRLFFYLLLVMGR